MAIKTHNVERALFADVVCLFILLTERTDLGFTSNTEETDEPCLKFVSGECLFRYGLKPGVVLPGTFLMNEMITPAATALFAQNVSVREILVAMTTSDGDR